MRFALNKPQDNDTAEEALGNVDLVALALMGAVDVSAGVAHRALGLDPSDEKMAKWQDKRWRKQVTPICPELAALSAAETPGRLLLRALGLLRNSIHREALNTLRVSGRAENPTTSSSDCRTGMPTDSLGPSIRSAAAMPGASNNSGKAACTPIPVL
jgi:hypothetical protein